MRQERGGYLRQHLAEASLTEKEKKRGYISIYRQGGEGMGRGSFPTARLHTQPKTEVTLHDTLSDQVPVEIIRDLLAGARRWN